VNYYERRDVMPLLQVAYAPNRSAYESVAQVLGDTTPA
jgi:hypothetical protein